jgi:signal transduction histidine kinase
VSLLEDLVDVLRAPIEEIAVAASTRDQAALDRAVGSLQHLTKERLPGLLERHREGMQVESRAALENAIARLASWIGHELRNPLSIIASSAFLLRQSLDPAVQAEPKVERHLQRITLEVQRSERLLSRLQGLSGRRPLRRRATALRPLLQSAADAANLPGEVEVVVSAFDDLIAALDEAQFGEALVALIVNASQAMEGRGTLWLEAERGGPEVWIRVRDNGPGVPALARPHLFEPLFTTKASGAGLGLALARQIVEAHGGVLELVPSEGGATFLLRLPFDA